MLFALACSAILAVYVSHHFIGMGPAPTRSAFMGRLPGKVVGDLRQYRIFYATNRANSRETFDGYGNVWAKNLTSGTFDVVISPYIPIAPLVWFDTNQMEILGRQEFGQQQFQSQLRQAVQISPQKSLLIIVWGFRDWFRSAALKTAYTAYALDINTPVVFDWPGNQGEGVRGYVASQRMASQSAPDLGRFLADTLRATGAENVWLVGSSLGCQTICESLVWLSTQPDLIQGKPKLAHIVLSAPDVSAEAFNDKFAQRIKLLTKHLTAYVSSNDRALLVSHWVNGARRLGRTAEVTVPPEQRVGQYEFEEAFELLALQAKGASNISIIDVTPINRLRNRHHFFTDAPEFFDDLYQRLLQPDDLVSRRLHAVRNNTLKATYWILWDN